MKKVIVTMAAIFIFSGLAYADKNCDQKYNSHIKAMKETTKISENHKEKYLASLEKAKELCQAGKLEEARRIFEEVQDDFFSDALFREESFYGE